MSVWRVLVCVLFATSVHAALPTAPGDAPDARWQPERRVADPSHRHAPDSAGRGPDHQSRLVRHRTYMVEGVPANYQGAASPVSRSRKAVRVGAALYARHCAACHGRKGRGGGDAGRTLKPPKALKTYISRRPWAADEYLLWSVAEGGAAFGSPMPAFREQLSRRQMWQIIAFMRAGFPRAARD